MTRTTSKRRNRDSDTPGQESYVPSPGLTRSHCFETVVDLYCDHLMNEIQILIYEDEDKAVVTPIFVGSMLMLTRMS